MNKSTRIAGIDNKYGRKSRTGSTISMNISDIEAMECQQYLMALEAGEEPTGKIKKIELIMYTEDDLKEVVELPNTDELDKAITLEDVIIEQDEKLTPNQASLDIFDKCEKCLHSPNFEPCNLECKYNPESKSNIDLFESIPMSQRL